MGNTAGYIGFIENLGTAGAATTPKWAAPKYLEADGEVIRVLAGENGSIQGPAEAKWGYTTIAVADWDHDGLADVVANSILGKVIWYRNVGTRTAPKLAAAQPIAVEWNGKATKPAWTWWDVPDNELHTQWRTTPIVVDVTADGLSDLVMLDRDGFLALFQRRRAGDALQLLPGKHIFRVAPGEPSVFDHNQKPVTFDTDNDGRNDLAGLRPDGKLTYYHSNPIGGKELVPNKHADRTGGPAFASADGATGLPLRLAGGWAGRSGGRKLAMTDWDGDGRLDLLVNSTNINFLHNVAREPGKFVFKDEGPVDDRVLAGHDTSPAPADFDGDGVIDLIVGAEDGFFYYMKNPRARAGTTPSVEAK